jgi:hypothetical protein
MVVRLSSVSRLRDMMGCRRWEGGRIEVLALSGVGIYENN